MSFEYANSNMTPEAPAAKPGDGSVLSDAAAGAKGTPAPEPNPMGDGTPTADVVTHRSDTPDEVIAHRGVYQRENLFFASQHAEIAEAIAPITNGYANRELNAEAFAADNGELASVLMDIGASSLDAKEFVMVQQQRYALPEAERMSAQGAADALRREWGDRYIENLKWARAAIAGDPRIGKALVASGLGNEPAVIKRLAELGRQQALKRKK
jgi:hypothetical protein